MEWKWIGCFWCAKDPVDQDVRWVIKKVEGKLPFKLFSATPKGGMKEIESSDSSDYLGFYAIHKRIKQANEMVYEYPHTLSVELVQSAQCFLSSLMLVK